MHLTHADGGELQLSIPGKGVVALEHGQEFVWRTEADQVRQERDNCIRTLHALQMQVRALYDMLPSIGKPKMVNYDMTEALDVLLESWTKRGIKQVRYEKLAKVALRVAQEKGPFKLDTVMLLLEELAGDGGD